ncbi:peptidylprolyl isomerase [Jiella sp. M17.18]|uniref:peptidylprolyl isomerase n=1 Tax=Jiella sp. M17.18 TaxID=3234247 RepID=UPI0034DE7F5A
MTMKLRLALTAGALALSTAIAAAAPAASPADSDVIAKVGSAKITEAELKAAQNDIGQQFQNLSDDQQRLAVLSALIDIKALAEEAEKANMQKDPQVAAQLAFERDRTLHNAYFAKKGVDTISDKDLKDLYDKEVKTIPPQQEIHARHILVKTKEEAQKIIDQLNKGADFETLAKKESTGPSGPKGGDLGWVEKGQLVPAFEKAAFALKPGEYTKEPVQTQFGWHVIKVEGERQAPPPSFDQVKDQLRQLAMRQKYMQLVQDARKNFKVEYVDPKVKKQVDDLEKSVAAGANGAAAGDAQSAAPATPAK